MNFVARTITTTILILGCVTWAEAKAKPKARPAPAPAPEAHAPAAAVHAEVPSGPAPDDALKMLREGNDRYIGGKLDHPHQDEPRRIEIAEGQHPFAIVLGCADSRVSPEVVFDQGLGDLFVVRVAGNILDDAGLASIEYAVEHLGARLIVVLGHEKCGAVKAARETIAAKAKAPGHLGALVDAIAPAVKATASKELDDTVKLNVLNVVDKLATSKPVLAGKVTAGDVKVVGARYDLNTGKVEILGH